MTHAGPTKCLHNVVVLLLLPRQVAGVEVEEATQSCGAVLGEVGTSGMQHMVT